MKNCLKCFNIENCRLRHIIRNPNIKSCNYAKEGCVHYKGDELGGTDKDQVLYCLKKKKEVDLDFISQTTGLPIGTKAERQIIWNAIARLIKEGYEITKFSKKRGDGKTIYSLK